MNIRFSPTPSYKAFPPAVKRMASPARVQFKGDKPPKMPDFLKPYHEQELEWEKKQPGFLKTALYVTGTVAGIVGLAVATHIFFPVVLAGLATFVGVLALVMGCFNKTVPQDKNLPELPPMTRKQQAEACRYEEALARYNRQQKIKKIKAFFGIQ